MGFSWFTLSSSTKIQSVVLLCSMWNNVMVLLMEVTSKLAVRARSCYRFILKMFTMYPGLVFCGIVDPLKSVDSINIRTHPQWASLVLTLHQLELQQWFWSTILEAQHWWLLSKWLSSKYCHPIPSPLALCFSLPSPAPSVHAPYLHVASTKTVHISLLFPSLSTLSEKRAK